MATPDAATTVTALKALVEPRGLTVLEPAEAASQNAFAVTEAYAEENDLETLTDLGNSDLSVVLSATEECPDRPFCLPALVDGYGITVSRPSRSASAPSRARRRSAPVRPSSAWSAPRTARWTALGLVVLEDDKSIQLADNLVPLVNSAGPGGTPEVATALNSLAPVLTTDDLAELNRRVDEDRELPDDVAADYLTEKNLIGPDRPSRTPIRVRGDRLVRSLLQNGRGGAGWGGVGPR